MTWRFNSFRKLKFNSQVEMTAMIRAKHATITLMNSFLQALAKGSLAMFSIRKIGWPKSSLMLQLQSKVSILTLHSSNL